MERSVSSWLSCSEECSRSCSSTPNEAKSWRALSFKLAKSRFFPLFGILEHVGRSSGRVYETSLGVHPLGDGFALPLAWGTHADWCRNVMAAGTCTLIWKGREYVLQHPAILPAETVHIAYPLWVILLFGGIALFGGFRGREIKQYLWLHQQHDMSEREGVNESSTS